MERNQKNRKTIKQKLFEPFKFLLKPCIVFESYPPFSDNTQAVYDEFLKQGFDKEYKLTWLVGDGQCRTTFRGKETKWNIGDRNTLIQKIRNFEFYSNTKAIVCCNLFLPSYGQACPVEENTCKSFYLSHGTPLKKVEDYYQAPEGIDYAISPAKAVTDIMADAFKINRSKYTVTGFPRNDVFFKDRVDLRGKMGANYKKIVLWYPTFRQTKKRFKLKGSSMPLIHKPENANILNDLAKNNNVLILLKPHFAQDTTVLHDLHLSNIRIIDDDFIRGLGISSYELIAASDAMITDYSSVYFDFTLCDKPIAVIWEDIEDYRQYPGFVIDPEEYMKGAEKIYTIEELCSFIEDVANDTDRHQANRREIRDLTNEFRDDKSAERTTNFIVEKAGLRKVI